MMKTIMICSVQVCLLLFCLLLITDGSPVREPKRSKLASIYALTPSLRVGRRSEGTWDPTIDLSKRKLAIFPRIGRGFAESKHTKNITGMWFGPRYGRVQKRNFDDDEYYPWTYIILNGEGVLPRQVDYTPRLGRESEEVFSEMDSSDAEDAYPA